MDTFIVHANSKVSKALKAIFKALNVSYELQKKESPYDSEFVKMVLESRNSSNRRVLDEAYKKELFGDL
jgi:hypothetical protein